MKRLAATSSSLAQPSSPWRGAGTSCRSIPRSIRTRSKSSRLLPSEAAQPLRDGKIQAYVGSRLELCGRAAGRSSAPSNRSARSSSCASIRIPPRAQDDASACAVVRTVMRDAGGARRFRSASLSGHAVPRRLSSSRRSRGRRQGALLDRRSAGRRTQDRRRAAALHKAIRNGPRRDADWDAEVDEVDAAELVASAMFSMNGWFAPPWVRTGWFHAERLLADAADEPAREQHIRSDLQRLKAGDFTGLVERINLERDLVTLADRRLPENRRRLHGQARIHQRRILRRDREHRLTIRSRDFIRRYSSAR